MSMHEVNVCLLKYEYQVSLCDTNPLGFCKRGIPEEAALGEGGSCQTGLFLEDKVKGAVTVFLTPAWRCGSFACLRLTGCVWHWRHYETCMSELSSL